MTFEEWWDSREYPYTDKDCAKAAWDHQQLIIEIQKDQLVNALTDLFEYKLKEQE